MCRECDGICASHGTEIRSSLRHRSSTGAFSIFSFFFNVFRLINKLDTPVLRFTPSTIISLNSLYYIFSLFVFGKEERCAIADGSCLASPLALQHGCLRLNAGSDCVSLLSLFTIHVLSMVRVVGIQPMTTLSKAYIPHDTIPPRARDMNETERRQEQLRFPGGLGNYDDIFLTPIFLFSARVPW